MCFVLTCVRSVASSLSLTVSVCLFNRCERCCAHQQKPSHTFGAFALMLYFINNRVSAAPPLAMIMANLG